MIKQQVGHIAWVTNISPGITEMDLTALLQTMGGLGGRDPVPAAVTLYMSTQSIIIPKVEYLLEDHLKRAWTEDTEFNNYVWAARDYLVNQGISSRQSPFGPEPRNTPVKSNMFMETIHKQRKPTH